MRCHLTPVRMAAINKWTHNKCWRGCGERGKPLHCRWECRLVQPLWKAVWRYLKKLKMELPYDVAISLLRIQLKKCETPMPKNISILHSLQRYLQSPRCGSSPGPSVDEWIKQLWDIYTMEYCPAIKKKILPFATV